MNADIDMAGFVTKFQNELDPSTRARVESCDLALRDPARLAALKKTGLMDTPKELAFDRLTTIAARVLNVPLTIISLVSDEKQFFKSAHGLLPPYDVIREIPITDSICRYTLRDEPIIAADAKKHELLKSHPTIGPWGIVAFIAIPMKTFDGQVLGAFCAVDVKVRPWSDDDLLLMQELTASVMREIHLRERIDELQAERELRLRFVTALSHDLRNPLNVVKMAAGLIGERESNVVERKMFLKMITENCDRADGMIQELLNEHSKQLGEKVITETEKADLVQTIRHSAESWKSIYGNRLHFNFPETFKFQINANLIRRVVENLIGNASKYGEHNGPISIAIKSERNAAVVSVHNVGNPIPTEDLQDIFKLFKRSESALMSQKSGWGIGLSVVRGLTEEMNGSVRVDSSAEHGTTFSVHLPIVFDETGK